MKVLHLEYPVDEHLKPIKDSDSILTTMEVSKTKLKVQDLEVTGTTTGATDDTKLPLAGGTMTGNVDFGDNDITNVDSLDADKFSIASGTEMTAIVDDDDMSADNATYLVTQQSIKAYVDAVPLGCFSKTRIKVMPTDFLSNDDRSTPYAVIEDDTADTLGIRVAHAAVELYAFVRVPDGYKATHVVVLASASTSNAVTCKTFNYTTGATTDLETFDFNASGDITDVVGATTADLVIKLAPAATGTIIYGATVTIASV